jgi:hypothetical protein
MARRRRPRRPSRFERAKEIGEPRYSPGERVRNVTVDVYRGYSSIVPGEARTLTCDHHWYECECDCGNRVIRTQQQLRDVRRSACGCPESEVPTLED